MSKKLDSKVATLETKLNKLYPELNITFFTTDGYSIGLHAASAVGEFTEYTGDKIPNDQIIAENKSYLDDLQYDTIQHNAK